MAGVLLLCCGTLSAQGDYASLIRENPDRAAGVHHSYEYLPGVTTPVPRGYKPFYVSHYGRHGSRRSTSSSAQKAFDYMDSARVAGILTPLGEELWVAVNAIHDDHIDMVGELTPRGGREHRAIARRLHDRVRPVWHDRHRERRRLHRARPRGMGRLLRTLRSRCRLRSRFRDAGRLWVWPVHRRFGRP